MASPKKKDATQSDTAPPAPSLTIEELYVLAKPALCAPDPLELIYQTLQKRVAGDCFVSKMVYLSATTRVLRKRLGNMLAHLQAIGSPGGGKSYETDCALMLFPNDAVVKYDAGSQRVIVYDKTPINHRVVYFREIDSIPKGDDSPAASAIRTLMQEGSMIYEAVIQGKDGHECSVQKSRRDGPAVLITTGVAPLPAQLGTRIFVVETNESQEQINAALALQAELEMGSSPEIPTEIIALQAYLQAWALASDGLEVSVPFVKALSFCMTKMPSSGTRVHRDFARIVSYIKAVALIRSEHRARDTKGRVIADLEDYAAVRNVLSGAYEATTAISGQCRQVIEAAQAVMAARKDDIATFKEIRVELERRMPKNRINTRKHLNTAVDKGYLTDRRTRKGTPWIVGIGEEAVPDQSVLPTVTDIQAAWKGTEATFEGVPRTKAYFGGGTLLGGHNLNKTDELRTERTVYCISQGGVAPLESTDSEPSPLSIPESGGTRYTKGLSDSPVRASEAYQGESTLKSVPVHLQSFNPFDLPNSTEDPVETALIAAEYELESRLWAEDESVPEGEEADYE